MNTTTDVRDVTIERLDDVPVLLAVQQRWGVGAVIDQNFPRHWLHQGLSLGQLVEAWNAYILSRGDHRKVRVRGWASDHTAVLGEHLGVPLRDTDFTDDRLGQVLTHLSDDTAWGQIEDQLWQRSVHVYRLRPDRVRLDATAVHGYHTVSDDGLMQYGHSPDHPSQPQVKMMAGSVDVGGNGHLVVTDIVSGERADDPLYVPVLQRLRQSLQEPGLLYLGDCKMSSLATRADIEAHHDYYLVPLSEVGEVPALLAKCIEAAVTGDQVATLIYTQGDTATSPKLAAAGYETCRSQSDSLPDGTLVTWEERLLVVRSLGQAAKERAAFGHRLTRATAALLALTCEPGRGRRPIRDEATLHRRAEAILTRHRVSGYVHYQMQREETTTTRYVGPGRGGPNRPQRTITHVHYMITAVTRDETAITEATWRLGWRLYGTNQPADGLPLEEAIPLYRHAPRVERHFHLLKAAPVGIAPLYVRRADQIKGLTRLLSLCVRLLTLIEIVVRRNLGQRGEQLAGLYEGNPKRQTARPTATRLLRAFQHIHRLHLTVAGQTIEHVTPLSPLQRQILTLLELSDNVYEVPIQNST